VGLPFSVNLISKGLPARRPPNVKNRFKTEPIAHYHFRRVSDGNDTFERTLGKDTIYRLKGGDEGETVATLFKLGSLALGF